MDPYADDLATLVEALDLRNAIHVGHSTDGMCTTLKDKVNEDLLASSRVGAGRSCDRHDPGRPSKKQDMRDLIRREFLEESPKIGARSVSPLPTSAVNAQP